MVPLQLRFQHATCRHYTEQNGSIIFTDCLSIVGGHLSVANIIKLFTAVSYDFS
jgi:hypothetical protein